MTNAPRQLSGRNLHVAGVAVEAAEGGVLSVVVPDLGAVVREHVRLLPPHRDPGQTTLFS